MNHMSYMNQSNVFSQEKSTIKEIKKVFENLKMPGKKKMHWRNQICPGKLSFLKFELSRIKQANIKVKIKFQLIKCKLLTGERIS